MWTSTASCAVIVGGIPALKIARYLVDTDCAAYYLAGREPFVGELLRRYDKGLALTALSVAELYECAQGSPDPKKAESSLEEFLSGVAVAPMTAALAREVGRAKARLTKSGVRVRCADLITACTARYYGLCLFTSRPERYEGLLPRRSIISPQGLPGFVAGEQTGAALILI